MPRRRPRRSLAAAMAAVSASSLSAVLLATPSAQAVSAQALSFARAESGGPTGISAVAGELVNVRTGKDMWARQAAIQRPIASLTKVMTALVVIRAGYLRRRITITQAEVNYVQTYGASNAGLQAGDILTARALLYGMLLPSGADAAMALAQSYGPGIPAFVRKMNALARKLHMRDTNFTNFDGLQQTDVSTPADLIRLGEAAMREPAFPPSGRSQAVVTARAAAPPPLLLAKLEPAAQALPRRHRDQDRMDAARGRMPAVLRDPPQEGPHRGHSG